MAEKPADASNMNGSYDVFANALRTQSAPTAPKPNAQGRDLNVPPATVGANQSVGQWLKGFLPGFAGGVAEVPAAPAPDPNGFMYRLGQDLQKPNYGLPLPTMDQIKGQLGITAAGQAIDAARSQLHAGQISQMTPEQRVAEAERALPQNVGTVAGNQVTPQPSGPVPAPPKGAAHPAAGVSPHLAGQMSPATHTLEQFMDAHKNLSIADWQALHPLLGPDMRQPAQAAYARLNQLTGTAVDANTGAMRKAQAAGDMSSAQNYLERAIMYARSAAGAGIGSLTPDIASSMRRGAVLPVE